MNTSGSAILDRSYRPDIDGLRAIAILSVVLYHSGVPLVTGGFTGVDIFFVISGYLIGGHIYSELRTGSFSYLRFYQRRAKRILPAFYVVLAFTMLAALLILTPYEAREFGQSAFAATLSGSNILFWRIGRATNFHYFNPTNDFNTLLMTWSLGVEEQFYAVIPLLLVLLARIRRGLLLPAILTVCTLSFLFAWLELPKHSTFVFYMLPARAWELGVGVALAVIELNRRKGTALSGPLAQASGVAGMVLMLAPVFLITKTTPFPGAAALPSVLGTALVIAAPVSWINRQLLSLRPLVFVGRVSYSWYLWHWPLLAFARTSYGDDLPPAASIMVVAAAFAAAVLSFYLVEQPLRKSHRAPVPLLLRYAAVSILILAACAIVWRSNGIPQRFPAQVRTEAEMERGEVQHDSCIVDEIAGQEPNLSPACYQVSGTNPRVALWGDSHAGALVPGLRSTSFAQGYGFVELIKPGCPPLLGVAVYKSKDPALNTWCPQFNRKSLSLLEADHSIHIVVLTAFWEAWLYPGNYDWLTTDSAHGHESPPTQETSRKLLVKSLAASIRSLQTAGKQVIVFEDVPLFAVDPVRRVRTASMPVRRALAAILGDVNSSDPGFAPPTLVSEAQMADSVIEQAVAGLQGVSLYDPKPELCSSAAHCNYRNGDLLLYADPGHLTADGSRYALRDFRLPTLAEISK